jgi:hypothetical protein
MWGISKYMRLVLEEEDGVRRRKSSIFFAVGFSFVLMTLIYFFPVRIGMVMFFTGIFSSLLFRDLLFVLRVIVGDFSVKKVAKSWFKGS